MSYGLFFLFNNHHHRYDACSCKALPLTVVRSFPCLVLSDRVPLISLHIESLAMAVSAFDLPQVWQKPAAADLLEALQTLRVEPSVWNLKISRSEIFEEQDTIVHHRREIAAYLSTIIKSELTWVDDEEDREAIWAEASKRFSERCGRSAIGEITRRWPFEPESLPPFNLVVREPPLTGDRMGLKTWGSSYVLAQLLDTIAQQSLSHLLGPNCSSSSRPTVLELGSGTGLLGLAAATIWRTRVLLSDLPDIMANLAHNLETNRAMIEASGGSVDSGALTWGGEEDDIDPFLFVDKNTFKVCDNALLATSRPCLTGRLDCHRC